MDISFNWLCNDENFGAKNKRMYHKQFEIR